ncbi:hypothetical protein BGZ76_008666 [Entomortierella beljakovae]|nr:hypothetical protein BGZ76_008666 [Entomortierella beljakovae]
MVQSLFAFGSNGNGQLGIGSDEDTSIPQLVQFIPTLDSIHSNHVNLDLNQPPFLDFAAGGNHSVLITREEQDLYMTGSNKDGELLLQEPAQEFTLYSLQSKNSKRLQWRSVACGWAFTIAITQPEAVVKSDDSLPTDVKTSFVNKVYAWGSGSFGELGLGPNLTKTGRNPIPIEKGLLDINSLSLSGLSTTTPPTQIEILKVRAGLRHVLLLVKETFNNGHEHEVVKSRISLLGWGSNRQGQLGQLERSNDPSQPYTEKELRGKFMEPTRIVISRDSLATDNNEEAPVIVDMACGQNHSLVLFSDGTVYSSGLNKYGQLGPCSTPDQNTKDFRIGFDKVHGLPFVDSVTCGWNHNAAMSNSDQTTIYLWGRNDHGQLGSDIHALESSPYSGVVKIQLPKPVSDHKSEHDSELEEFISYSCGSEHTLAMVRSGDCYSWGWNEHGNCSRGTSEIDDRQNVRSPRKVNFSSSTLTKSRDWHGWVAGGYGSSWVWT